MIKHYWKDDSWWDSPECSCCQGQWMENYNLVDDEGNYLTHSVSSGLECLVESYMIHNYGPYHERSDEEDLIGDALLLKEEDYVRKLCEGSGLEVIIEEVNEGE